MANIIFFAVPIAGGLLAGYLAGSYGTFVAAAGMFLLTMLVVQDLEVPGWYIGLWLGGFAALAGLVGTYIRSRRTKDTGLSGHSAR